MTGDVIAVNEGAQCAAECARVVFRFAGVEKLSMHVDDGGFMFGGKMRGEGFVHGGCIGGGGLDGEIDGFGDFVFGFPVFSGFSGRFSAGFLAQGVGAEGKRGVRKGKTGHHAAAGIDGL